METCKIENIFKDVEINDEIKKLVIDTYVAYGGLKHALLSLKNDHAYYIDLMLLNESVYSLNIKEERVAKNSIFYLKYLTDISKAQLIKNNKKAFLTMFKTIKESREITIEDIMNLNKLLLSKVKMPKKEIGAYRKKQTYVMKLGLVGKTIDYVPIKKNYISKSMDRVIKDLKSDKYDYLINIGLFDYRFLSIHPFISANGRSSRIMIPLLFNYYINDDPILMISEALEYNKASYYRALNSAREGNINEYIKFFLQMCILQCSMNINRIDKINKIYEQDYEMCKKEVSGSLIKGFYPYMSKKIVFCIGDITKDMHYHINSANKLVKRLLELGIISKLKEKGTNRITYRYDRMYNVFIPKEKNS